MPADMKTSALDFLLAGTALLALLACGLALTVFLVWPVTVRWFGDFHVLADTLAFLLAFGCLAALLTRLLLFLRPLRPGDYRMDEGIFTYWKLLTVIHEFGRGALLPFTTVFARPLVAVLFGARVGANTAFGGKVQDLPLVSIGDGAVLGHGSLIAAHAITSGRIILGEVRIGSGATIGVNVVVMAGTEVGEGAVVAAGSVLPPFSKVPGGELWGGIPAKRIKALESSDVRS